jgi:hypothetical protein
MLGIADRICIASNPCSMFWTPMKVIMEALSVFKMDYLNNQLQTKHEIIIDYHNCTAKTTTEQCWPIFQKVF